MNLEEQIIYTKEELDNYRKSQYSSIEIIKWLEGIYESLNRLKDLEK